MARSLGARLVEVDTHELELEAYTRNNPDRCFHCKEELFETLEPIRVELGLQHLAYGATADDAGDHRPGHGSAVRRGVRFPLLEAGLAKADIRAAARQLGLANWNKPSFACLSSRIPHGTEGTTGATAVVIGLDGEVRGKGNREISQHFPQPGWVEHDAEEIWSAVQDTAAQALNAAGAQPREVRAVGITNQRETLVMWDRKTLKPLGRAIVWQDRRTTEECIRLREAGHDDEVREVTGLVLDPYFTATKAGWAMKHVEGARDAALGTVDSWLVARLSHGRDHVTDASNASRTMLFDIRSGRWSAEMSELFGVPLQNLPEVRDSSGAISRTSPDVFGGVDAPITGIAGDQQSALFGQACTTVGMAKNTYGTGSFVLLNTGGDRVMSKTGMLTTVAWRRAGELTYALEGAIFVTGAALQWLRGGLGIIQSAAEAGPLAESIPD